MYIFTHTYYKQKSVCVYMYMQSNMSEELWSDYCNSSYRYYKLNLIRIFTYRDVYIYCIDAYVYIYVFIQM
jgi:hypothetical protein